MNLPRKILNITGLGAIAFVLSLLISFLISVLLNEHRSNKLVITQEISVPDTDEETYSTNNFFWSEITGSAQFGHDFNEIYFANEPQYASIILPPSFFSDVFHDRICCPKKCKGQHLCFRLYEDWHFDRKPDDKTLEDRLNKFNVGRDLFIDRLKQRGVPAESIGSPKIIYRPLYFLYDADYFIWRATYVGTPGAIAIIIILLIIQIRGSKKLQPTPVDASDEVKSQGGAAEL